MSTPLKLYWWNDLPNFGDRLSVDVVKFISGREVRWSEPDQCDLFALGSLMKFVRRGNAVRRHDGVRPWIWGTGMINAVRRDFLANVRVAAVRGPLTAALLELGDDLPVGDPGLLCPLLFEQTPQRTDAVGIVLHHSQKPEPHMIELVARDSRFRLIDVTQLDHMDVVRRIAECRYVFSSSLHGLVVADAFGIPNQVLQMAGIHASATFKFYDYALSVGRLFGRPIRQKDIAEFMLSVGQTSELPYSEGVRAAQAALRNAFPTELLVAPR